MNFFNALKIPGPLIIALVVGCTTQPKPAPVVEQKAVNVTESVQSGPSPEATQAIAVAKDALAKAESVDGLWRDASAILQEAEQAAEAGYNDKAVKLADQARHQGEMGYNQAYLEKAKFLMEKLKGYRSRMSDQQQATLASAESAWQNYEGKRSYDAASALLAEL